MKFSFGHPYCKKDKRFGTDYKAILLPDILGKVSPTC